MPELVPMLTMSNKTFKLKFGPMSGSWRGKKPLQRNAIIALVNLRDRSVIPKLLEVIDHDPRPVIRATAAWGVAELSDLQNQELLQFLKNAKAREDSAETDILNEYQQAIDKLVRLPKLPQSPEN